MASRTLSHIPVKKKPDSVRFSGYGSPINSDDAKKPPAPDRAKHGAALAHTLETIAKEFDAAQHANSLAQQIPSAEPGLYLEVQSQPKQRLELDQLTNSASGLRLVAFRAEESNDQAESGKRERAVFFAPKGDTSAFSQRARNYTSADAEDPPKSTYKKLFDPLETLARASFEDLWTDLTPFPPSNEARWWELWLKRTDRHEIERLKAFAAHQHILVADQILAFRAHIVTLVYATAELFAPIANTIQDLVEVRSPSPTGAFFVDLPGPDQREWTAALLDRVASPPDDSPIVCILDTGVNFDHPLIKLGLSEADCHTYHPDWRINDHHGHGTEMAGLALLGDLAPLLEGDTPLQLTHRLESVKIHQPLRNQKSPQKFHNEAIALEAISRVEVSHPSGRRVIAQAITAGPNSTFDGRPRAWSSTIDAIIAGRDIDLRDDGIAYLSDDTRAPRLFLISAGNIPDNEPRGAGPYDTNDTSPIHDPAQAWNALTVGAYTNKTLLSGDPGDGTQPLAAAGDVAPMSSTSVSASRRWPNKPEVLFEGGNWLGNTQGEISSHADLNLLTTSKDIVVEHVRDTWGTSPATALAARMAAQIWAHYPDLWPETVRGLMVHSARWTPAMEANLPAKPKKTDRDTVLRRYGFGVPDLAIALKSAKNDVTLYVEDELRPYTRDNEQEIHYHRLPWPTDVLQDIGSQSVKLRVTLSYFIDPNPATIARDKANVYQSHKLKFDLKMATESEEAFRKRINQKDKPKKERRGSKPKEGGDWFFSQDERFSGSLHSDWWEGLAQDLAARDFLAVYPEQGWWSTAKDPSIVSAKVRYALIVSIESTDEQIDLWTPVALEAGIEVPSESIVVDIPAQ
ncbi:MAG: S8 family peptidase [Thermomicrobiales bacterium]